MAVDYSEKFVVAQNPSFVQKVTIALSIESVDRSGNPGFDQLPDREKRLVKAIAENAVGIGASSAMILAAKEDLETDSTDLVIQTAVTTHWESLAWMLDSI